MDNSWFVIERPDGAAVREVEVVISGSDRRKVSIADINSYFDLINQLSSEQDTIKTHFSGSFADKLRYVLDHYRDLATRQLRRTKEFRDDMLTWLRAMAIVVESAGNASTHREKAARIRGAIEIIEGAVSTLRKQEFEIGHGSYFPFDDIFRSDYPTRELLARIQELEAVVTDKAIKEPGTSDGMPF